MVSVAALCAVCKRPLDEHIPSRRRDPKGSPKDKVRVVNGRCIVDGEPAAQGCRWGRDVPDCVNDDDAGGELDVVLRRVLGSTASPGPRPPVGGGDVLPLGGVVVLDLGA